MQLRIRAQLTVTSIKPLTKKLDESILTVILRAQLPLREIIEHFLMHTAKSAITHKHDVVTRQRLRR